MSNSRVFSWIAVMVIGFFAVSLSYGAERSMPDARDKITVSYSAVSPSFGALWVAKEGGIFQRNGLDVRLILIQSSPTNVQALLNNEIQIAVAGATAVINSALAGLDLVFIGGMHESMLYHLIADSSIKTPQDLKGKKIGISRFGSSSHYAVEAVLKKVGLDPRRDVTILQAGGENLRAAAISKGGIQATVITPPLHSAYKKLGLHTVLSLSEFGIPYLTNAIITRQSYYNAHPSQARGFLRSMVEAFAFFKKSENKPFVLNVLARYLGLNVEADREVISQTRDVFANEFYNRVPYVTREGLTALIRDLGEKNPEILKLRQEELIRDSYLSELEKSGFVDRLYK